MKRGVCLPGKACCPASCGEIVQGNIDGRDFLVTCPISLYTEVTVELIPEKCKTGPFYTQRCLNGSGDYNESPDKYNFKSYLAARKTLQFFGITEFEPVVAINSQIPRGIGLSSSTADITAACMAAAAALGKSISPDAIADIAISIEPSDGIMYRGAVIFDHIRGTWRESLGAIPDMDVYIIDTGEIVDTGEFNSRKDLPVLNKKKEAPVAEAIETARKAIINGDIKLLGEAMEKSAAAHQEILYKPHLNGIIETAAKFGAVGVNIAHSGSAIGMFFEKNCQINRDLWKELSGLLKKYGKMYRIIKTGIDNNGPRQIQCCREV